MPIAMQSYTPHTEMYECKLPPAKTQKNTKATSNSWGTTIKNALFGRVCSDWTKSILVVVSVAHVMAAVVCLVTGQWLFSILFFATAGYEASLHREMRKFANWDKHLATTNRENHRLILSNHRLELNNQRLEQTAKKLHADVEKLAEGLKKQEEENAAFAESNFVYKTLLSEMREDTKKLSEGLNNVITKGGKVNEKMLRSSIKVSKHLNSRIETIETMRNQMDEKQQATLDSVLELSKAMKVSSKEHMQVMQAALTATAEAEKNTAVAKQELESLLDQITTAKQELTAVVTELKSTTKISRANEEGANRALSNLNTVISNVAQNFIPGQSSKVSKSSRDPRTAVPASA